MGPGLLVARLWVLLGILRLGVAWLGAWRLEALTVGLDLALATGRAGQRLKCGGVQLPARLGALASQVGTAEALQARAGGRGDAGAARCRDGRGGRWRRLDSVATAGRLCARRRGRKSAGRFAAADSNQDAPGRLAHRFGKVAGGRRGHPSGGEGAGNGNGGQPDPASPPPLRGAVGGPGHGHSPQLGEGCCLTVELLLARWGRHCRKQRSYWRILGGCLARGELADQQPLDGFSVEGERVGVAVGSSAHVGRGRVAGVHRVTPCPRCGPGRGVRPASAAPDG